MPSSAREWSNGVSRDPSRYWASPHDRRLVIESPEMHNSSSMQAFIKQEVVRPSKQWIHEVLGSKREVERVKMRTAHFVLLPDVDSISRRVVMRKTDQVLPSGHESCKEELNPTPLRPSLTLGSERICRRWHFRYAHAQLHWLAVVTDTNLRTLRDLRGHHVQMLQNLYNQCCQKIQEETGIAPENIMAYVHYPPSVYQLHIHFKHPINVHTSLDTFRVHSLVNIINNLQIDPEYYAKSLLQLPVSPNTELFAALGFDSKEIFGASEQQEQPRFPCHHLNKESFTAPKKSECNDAPVVECL